LHYQANTAGQSIGTEHTVWSMGNILAQYRKGA
jgi:hypothetical protein